MFRVELDLTPLRRLEVALGRDLAEKIGRQTLNREGRQLRNRLRRILRVLVPVDRETAAARIVYVTARAGTGGGFVRLYGLGKRGKRLIPAGQLGLIAPPYRPGARGSAATPRLVQFGAGAAPVVRVERGFAAVPGWGRRFILVGQGGFTASRALVFQRTTQRRLPIRRIDGPSAAQVLRGSGAVDRETAASARRLEAEVAKRVERELRRALS